MKKNLNPEFLMTLTKWIDENHKQFYPNAESAKNLSFGSK